MANLQATLRAQVLVNTLCNECIARANKLLYQSTDSKKFATLFYGLLDFHNHQLSYCNAGHDNPFFITESKEVKRLDKGGTVLGFLPEALFEIDSLTINPGDLLVIYSDGITESMNENEEEFGENNLLNVIIDNRNEPADKILQTIIDTAKKYSGNSPQMDDMTIVVIKRDY
jgi:sigma-B regulation protein RsbU (phosphoserine phosphatase)